MFLSKLTVDVFSRQFRRDYADVHEMHRTIMSAFPALPEGIPAREHHSVLWRLDGDTQGYTLYVQSRTRPDWTTLPHGYLRARAQVRCLQPALEAIQPGHTLAFRMIANPTRSIHAADSVPGQRGRGKRVAVRDPEDQIAWLLRQGRQHGFAIPAGDHGPDVAPSPCPKSVGHKAQDDGEAASRKQRKVTISPVRFDGHLIVTDPDALTTALTTGIGRAKAYGCGLLSLAPARKTHN